jgi:hypothetical protein
VKLNDSGVPCCSPFKHHDSALRHHLDHGLLVNGLVIDWGGRVAVAPKYKLRQADLLVGRFSYFALAWFSGDFLVIHLLASQAQSSTPISIFRTSSRMR